jgi:acyl-homoserine-lactone acylase
LSRHRMFKLTGSLAIAGILAILVMTVRAHLQARSVAEDARLAADAFSAEIIRDEFGVPHIYGSRDRDVAFGLAYAHAEDDWRTIETTLLAARGELARHEGPDAAPTDYIVRLFRIQELVSTRYETDLTAESRALVEAYAAGLNLYAVENSGAARDGVLPVTGQDIVAGFVLRTPFMYGLDADLSEILSPTRQRSVSMSSAETAFQVSPALRLPFGSNAIAIAPHRSDDGATRLLINSHQPYSGPVAWYEASLHSEEGLEMYGGTFPGAPLILHGHNRDLAWAHTVNHPDLADIYLLETDGDQYRYDGEWRPLEHGTARINVRLFGPVRWTVSRDLWWSEHGPVLRTEHGDYAIRYSGMDEIGQVEQWYGMNRATSFGEWMAAMSINAMPSLNAVYADREGQIGYVYNARMPDRPDGWDWTQYLPGDRSDLVWTDYQALAEMPIYVDPPSGWLISANQTPFDATAVEDNLSPTDYAESFGIQPRMTNRAWRGLELIRAMDQIGRDDLLGIKFDKTYSSSSAVGRLVAEILALDLSDDPDLQAAQRMLSGWDLSTDVENRQAALGVLTAVRCIGNRHTNDPWLMDPREALAAAAEELMRYHGRLDPEWGAINRLVRGAVDTPIGGGPDVLRAVYAGGPHLGEDGRIEAVAGDTYIMLVEWDADGELSSQSIHQFGSATLDQVSPHYDDQAQLFADEAWRSVRLDRDEILNAAARPYCVGAAPRDNLGCIIR